MSNALTLLAGGTGVGGSGGVVVVAEVGEAVVVERRRRRRRRGGSAISAKSPISAFGGNARASRASSTRTFTVERRERLGVDFFLRAPPRPRRRTRRTPRLARQFREGSIAGSRGLCRIAVRDGVKRLRRVDRVPNDADVSGASNASKCPANVSARAAAEGVESAVLSVVSVAEKATAARSRARGDRRRGRSARRASPALRRERLRRGVDDAAASPRLGRSSNGSWLASPASLLAALRTRRPRAPAPPTGVAVSGDLILDGRRRNGRVRRLDAARRLSLGGGDALRRGARRLGARGLPGDGGARPRRRSGVGRRELLGGGGAGARVLRRARRLRHRHRQTLQLREVLLHVRARASCSRRSASARSSSAFARACSSASTCCARTRIARPLEPQALKRGRQRFARRRARLRARTSRARARRARRPRARSSRARARVSAASASRASRIATRATAASRAAAAWSSETRFCSANVSRSASSAAR